MRITPEDIYDPGVTIQSFANVLTQRLAREQPYVLHQLLSKAPKVQQQQQQQQQHKQAEENGMFDQEKGVVDSSSVDKGSTNDITVAGGGDGEGSDGDDTIVDRDVLAWNRHFDRVLASNRLLLDGLRGACSLLVLYDHFHNPRTIVSDALAVDTYLFVVLSGFTTALQCRQTPQTKIKTQSTSASTSPGQGQGQGQSRLTNASILLPRQSFPLGPFLMSRALGLLPILWIAILLNIPPW